MTKLPDAAALAGPRLDAEPRSSIEGMVPPEMRATRRVSWPIAIQPLGPVPHGDIAFLRDLLEAVLGTPTEVLAPLPLTDDLFDASRGQYDADRMLDLLFQRLPDHCTRIVGALDRDMFAAGRTFVFGYAHLRDGMAVYSLARLREEWYGRRPSEGFVRTRAYRAVVHELGHTFGNPHCDEPSCVMHAVSHVESLDALSPSYCEPCMRRVRRGILVSPSSAEGRFQRGGALLRRRELSRAAEAYGDAVRLNGREARYHNDLGVALLSLGERDGARDAFLRAADLATDFPHPYYNLGILCRDEGGAPVAARWFAEGLARDADPLAAHRYIGRLYEELFSDPVRARQHYLAYLQLGGREEDVIARAYALAPY